MIAYTDYPIVVLGDKIHKEAPIRQVKVLDYDGNKYCNVLLDGIVVVVKAGYLYKEPGRCGEVECINPEDIFNPDYPSYTQTIPSESKSELPSTFKSMETRATSVSGFFLWERLEQ